MKTRLIIVPKDKKAELNLDYDNAKDEVLIQYILNEEIFIKLYNLDFFNFINNFFDVNIDDFEDESIEFNKLEMGLSDFKKKFSLIESKFDNIIFNEVKKIFNLFDEAMKRKTGIYFYF